MITTVIALAVIAVALSGLVAFDIFRGKMSAAGTPALAFAGKHIHALEPPEQAAKRPAERVSQIASANDGSTGGETPDTDKKEQAPKKRGRKVYQDPVIIFVKPWLIPKIKDKKKRNKKVESESEPQEAETYPQATEAPFEVAPAPEPLSAEAPPQVTETPQAEPPETFKDESAPAPEEVKAPESDNYADDEPAQAELPQEEIAAVGDTDEVDDYDDEDDTAEADGADEADDEVTAAIDETADADDEKENATVALRPVTEDGKTKYIVIKYSRSFLAKLIQSDEWVKRCYSELKNKLLTYGGVKSRISWKCESFRKGRTTIAKLRLRGKTLSLCFVGDPDGYVGTKYAVESLAEVKSYAATPCMYRIRSNRRLLYAKQLIEKTAEQNGLAARPTEQTDYVAQYPYETTDALVERKLIKVLTDDEAQSGTAFKPSEVRAEVAATEVDNIMSDEVAASLIEKSEGSSDRTKQGIINIDTLSQYFCGGEAVTLGEIKNRVKGFNKKTTYIKVLARGTLDKPLTVEADSFSLQAVKMIVLTGGKAIKKQ